MFIGGSVGDVDGEARGPAAALDLATGHVTPWRSHIDRELFTIAARDGRVFVVGGRFSRIDDEEIYGSAALDANTGALLDRRFRGGEVTDIVVGSRAVVMLGYEASAGVQAFDVTTGERLPWFAGVTLASALAVDGDTLYVAGSGVSAWDLRDGSRLPYTGATSGDVMAAGGGAVAVGLRGSGVQDRVARNYTAAIDLRTGSVLPFDPHVDGGVLEQFPNYIGPWLRTLEKVGSTVYLGGVFATVGGYPQTHLAAVDAVTRVATRVPVRARRGL